jgi:hypothetical protein
MATLQRAETRDPPLPKQGGPLVGALYLKLRFCRADAVAGFQYDPFWQGNHNPKVGGSNPAPAKTEYFSSCCETMSF